jgi:hypothetical protein
VSRQSVVVGTHAQSPVSAENRQTCGCPPTGGHVACGSHTGSAGGVWSSSVQGIVVVVVVVVVAVVVVVVGCVVVVVIVVVVTVVTVGAVVVVVPGVPSVVVVVGAAPVQVVEWVRLMLSPTRCRPPARTPV